MSEFIFGIVFALVLSPLYVPIIVISVCVVQAVHWWRASIEDANSAVNRLSAALAERRASVYRADNHRLPVLVPAIITAGHTIMRRTAGPARAATYRPAVSRRVAVPAAA